MIQNVAVIGTGSIGMRHLCVLKEMGKNPVAIPKRRERLEELEKAGFKSACSLQEAGANGVTHCFIATDTSCHVEDGLAAIDAGMNLLIEKPLSISQVSTLPLLQKAKEKGKKIFVGCVFRFSKSLQTFCSLLKEIGNLYTVRIECQSYLPDWRPHRPYALSYSARAEEGGVLRDLVHEIDYAGWIFGWPKTVQATLRNLGRLGIEVEETADLNWISPDGVLVSMSLDYLSRLPRRLLRAHGEFGVLEWDGVVGQVTLNIPEKEPRLIVSSQTRDEMFRNQAASFLQQDGSSVGGYLATVEDGMRALAVCDAAREASKARREESVSYLIKDQGGAR